LLLFFLVYRVLYFFYARLLRRVFLWLREAGFLRLPNDDDRLFERLFFAADLRFFPPNLLFLFAVFFLLRPKRADDNNPETNINASHQPEEENKRM
jgi:hypothetical protein